MSKIKLEREVKIWTIIIISIVLLGLVISLLVKGGIDG